MTDLAVREAERTYRETGDWQPLVSWWLRLPWPENPAKDLPVGIHAVVMVGRTGVREMRSLRSVGSGRSFMIESFRFRLFNPLGEARVVHAEAGRPKHRMMQGFFRHEPVVLWARTRQVENPRAPYPWRWTTLYISRDAAEEDRW